MGGFITFPVCQMKDRKVSNLGITGLEGKVLAGYIFPVKRSDLFKRQRHAFRVFVFERPRRSVMGHGREPKSGKQKGNQGEEKSVLGRETVDTDAREAPSTFCHR